MRKFNFYTYLILSATLFLFSCRGPMDSPVPVNGHLHEVLREGIYSFNDLKASLLSVYPTMDVKNMDGISKITGLLDTSGKVRSTAISYTTKDPNGSPILASGLIMRPEGRKSKGVLHFFPSAKIDKNKAGSELMLTFEGLLSFFGYTVIVPDLVGYGISSYAEYPFLFSDNTGLVAYDMHLATAEYFRSQGIPFSKKVTIGGYSMGGMGVVSLHRHIEKYDEAGIVVEHSYPGGGVYDLGMAVDVLAQTKYCTFPFVPYMYVAMDYWYELGLHYEDVFIDPLLSNMDDWLSRKYLAHEMREFIGADLTTYMHPDFFTDEKNESLNKVDSCLRLHSVIEGWVPRAPMTIIHTEDDTMAPFQTAECMYETFKHNGGNVNLIRGKGDHFNYGFEYYITMLLYLLLK
ncbi:MAG: alpha/beta hydrolase [Bacteroidales bacterium]|jgi:pimeloyl-ACP methyl ester carboxylesterase